MDIRCERCATEYELDEARIPDAGFTLKCATCGHVFKVMKTAAGISLRLFRGGDPVPAFCPDSATLQRWIIEQRILKDDEISFNGQPWRRLSEVPELTAFFALLSMPPPVLRTQPTPAGVPPVVSTPAPPPVVAPPPPAPVAAPPPVAAPVSSEAPTVLVPAVPAPALAKPEVHEELPKLSDHVAEKTPAPAPEAKPAAAAPPPPAPPAPAPAAAKPAPPPPPPAPKPAAKPAPAPKPAPTKKPLHPDPDIAAIMARGRTNRIITIGVFVVLAVAIAAFFLWPDNTPKGPPQQARVAFRRGHDLYLSDTLASFQMAEDSFLRAIKEGGKDGYPEAQGALAELRVAWAEQLMARNAAMLVDLQALQIAGQTEEAEKLRKKANDVANQANEKLSAAISDVNAMKVAGTITTEARRAGLDFYRLKQNAQEANGFVEALKASTDPETQAHVAEWLSQDPSQRAGAEATLKDIVQKTPDFLRARWWLADLHVRAGNTTEALADAQEILKVSPNHILAKVLVDSLQKATALTASAAPDAGPTTAAAVDAGPAPEVAAPEKKPETAPTPEKKPATDVAKAPPPEKKDPVAKKDPATPAGGAFDVDKAVDQAAAFLDRKKPKKALELFDQILQRKPKMTDALYGKGVALRMLGKTDEAITAFKKTLEVNPRFGDAMFDLGEAYKKLKDNKSAARYYQQYVDTFPTGAQVKLAQDALKTLH